MVPSLTGVPINDLRLQDAVPIHKQDQCTQEFYIKTGSDNSLDQLVASYYPYQKYMRTIKQ